MDELILLKKKVLELEEANLLLKKTEKKLRATNQKLSATIKRLEISEEQLKAKHEMLIRTQRIAHVGSWEWDLASDSVFWSDEMFRIFRLNPEDGAVSFAHQPNIYTPESIELLDKAVKHSLQTGESYEIDSEIIRGDMTTALCSVRGVAQKDENGKVIKLFGYLQDITERKRLEDQLIASEKQFRQLFENMEQGFALHKMIYDKSGNPIDYRFVLINNAFTKLTGINGTSLIGKTIKEVLPNLRQIWIDNYAQVAKTGKPIQFEHYSQEFCKYYNVAAYSPQQNYFATIFSDTTQEKLQSKHLLEAKEKAEESQIKFKAAFYTNPDAININKMDGEYVEVNEGFTRLMGYTAEDVIGKRSIEIDIWNNLEDREKLIEGLKEFGIVDNLES
ncbi:MAG: PAS domain S-box protein, partial [Bacteroidales bacterium]|nr:PAS domain S-box protein [Bacteroidales bacterium]